MSYAKWRKRLEIYQQHATVAARRDALKAAGVMTYPQPDLDDVGYYALAQTQPTISKSTGQPNGRHDVIGLEPVAYYAGDDGELRCSRNGFDVSDDEATAIWTYVVSHPITEDEYRAMTGETTEAWGEER